MMAVQENNIARQFSRAAAAYDHTASIQKQIAKAGLAMLPGNTRAGAGYWLWYRL